MPKFKIGDKVTVPWGFETVDGTVVDAYGPYVRVWLNLTDDDEYAQTIGFRAENITLRDAATA